MVIDSQSTVVVAQGKNLIAYDENEYVFTAGYGYPAAGWVNSYRSKPTMVFNSNSRANLINSGTIIVSSGSGIAGPIYSEYGSTPGTLTLEAGSNTLLLLPQFTGTCYSFSGQFITRYRYLKDLRGNYISYSGTYKIWSDNLSDPNSKKLSKEVEFIDENGVPHKIVQVVGDPWETPTLPAGYYWSTDNNTPDYVDVNGIFRDASIDKLYAMNHTGTTYTITFNLNEGTGVSSTTLPANSSINLIDNYRPTKGNDIFLGWYTDNNFDKRVDQISPLTADTQLYARWVNNIVYTITLKNNKGVEYTESTTARNGHIIHIYVVIKDGNGDPLKGIPVNVETKYGSDWQSTNHLGLISNANGEIPLVKHKAVVQSGGLSSATEYYNVYSVTEMLSQKFIRGEKIKIIFTKIKSIYLFRR